MVLADPLFYLLNSLHITLVYVQHQCYGSGKAYLFGILVAERDTIPQLSWGVSTFIGTLLTFFLTFCARTSARHGEARAHLLSCMFLTHPPGVCTDGTECYKRYQRFYDLSIGIANALGDWTQLVRMHFGREGPEVRWRLVRMMLAAMHVHYAYLGGLDHGETAHGESRLAITTEEWRAIRRKGLLSDKESEELRQYCNGRETFLARFLTARALTVVVDCLRKKHATDLEARAEKLGVDVDDMDEHMVLTASPAYLATFSQFQAVAKQLRHTMSQQALMNALPPPFVYYHTLKMILVLGMLITSYALIEVKV